MLRKYNFRFFRVVDSKTGTKSKRKVYVCMWMNFLIIDTTKIILARKQYKRTSELGLDSE